jgi:hypothetical protein
VESTSVSGNMPVSPHVELWNTIITFWKVKACNSVSTLVSEEIAASIFWVGNDGSACLQLKSD